MIEKGLINPEILNPQEFEKASPTAKIKDNIYDGNHFVFATVCSDPAGPGDYFEEVIEARMKIPPLKQHDGLIVSEEMLFQLAIDFCRYFNDKFDEYGERTKRRDSLGFAIGWLEDMRHYPDKHKAEWKIWEKTIEYVLSPGDKHLIF
ncbi:MAG: hypothetical protein KDK56_03485 [Simkania sp.]|nr:hypothetical protein [Simkania sp.]MCP5491371.1 hypothetical protein [Chlamydiales bacterium]